ncbi:hypothetical protein AAHA92_04157 [Salvia divinorum]|uniref:Uncharacterized protein n=1 Tax=Salvia divinorum TaxID=28513 RepID=A0ABD1HYC0_SALDI
MILCLFFIVRQLLILGFAEVTALSLVGEEDHAVVVDTFAWECCVVSILALLKRELTPRHRVHYQSVVVLYSSIQFPGLYIVKFLRVNDKFFAGTLFHQVALTALIWMLGIVFILEGVFLST